MNNISNKIEKNIELRDLSNLETTNFTILFSVLAIAITLSFQFRKELDQIPILKIYIILLIFYTLLLISSEMYVIYKNDNNTRLKFFNVVISYLLFIGISPILLYIVIYFQNSLNGDLLNDSTNYNLMTMVAGIIASLHIFLLLISMLIFDKFIYLKLKKRFKILAKKLEPFKK